MPHAARPRPSSPPGLAATGRSDEEAEREAAGARPPPVARTAAAAPLPPTCGRPRPPEAPGHPDRAPAAPVLTRRQQGQEHHERSHGPVVAATLKGGTDRAGGTRATSAAVGGDALRLVPTPWDRPVVASAGTAAAFSTNRQLRRGLRERRRLRNVSLVGGA